MSKHDRKTVDTTWELRTYDVIRSRESGYEVNDSYSHGEISLRLRVQTASAGLIVGCDVAYPSDYQFGQVFGTSARLSIDGDDVNIYVSRERDGYPLGELVCTSHASLSPIRERDLSHE